MPSPTASMQLDIGSVRATLIALEHSTGDIEEAAWAALAAGSEVLLKHARRVLSLTDHTLKDLRRLGHPYARRMGRIRIHKATPWKVHTHTGQLLRALKDTAYDAGSFPAHLVYIDTSAAPYAEYIVEGTPSMLPRDPLWTGTALQPAVQKQVMQAIIRVLGKEMRTKLGIRFQPRSGSGTVI